MPIPKSNETESEYMKRCMLDHEMISKYDTEQRVAVCKSFYTTEMANEKISFDYDGTFSTAKGFDMAVNFINKGIDVYIISARNSKDEMLPRANKAKILFSKVYATGSNEEKIAKVKELGITTHYDNNPDVVNALDGIGKLI